MKQIKDLQGEDAVGRIRQPFLIKSCEEGATNTSGALYLNITLADATGTMEARKWDMKKGDREIFVPNTVVEIDGSIINYRGKNQIKINSGTKLDQSTIDRSLYVPHAPVSVPDMKCELRDLVNSIQDEQIRELTQAIINDTWPQYSTHPAAVTVHQAYESGLLFHSISVCKVALAIADLYPGTFHRDYLICGCLLHDIGKTWELSGPVSTKYTRIGKLEGHINIGAILINNKCHELGLDEEKTELLTHILFSHHGLPEYGSPVVPKTADAFLVHLADDCDAKVNVIQNYLKTVRPGEFTARIPWMDNIELYRPSFDRDDDAPETLEVPEKAQK